MDYLSKFLLCLKNDAEIFSRKDSVFIFGLTTSQIKDLKRYALANDLIEFTKKKYLLTAKGEQELTISINDLWENENYPKRPKVNLECLKAEKASATLTKAIRLLSRSLLNGSELKENSLEDYLSKELLSEKSNCKRIKKELEKDILNHNKYAFEPIFKKYQSAPYGLTKSIFTILFLSVLAENKSQIAIYENRLFQVKLDDLLFDRMIYAPHRFELQKTVFKRNLILENISELLLTTKSYNILEVTKGLICFIKSLDKYTIKTQRLTKTTLRFKNCIINSKDPIHLFERDLPKILCGKVLSKCGGEFVLEFEKAMDELQNSYLSLRAELLKDLFDSFKTESKDELKTRFIAVEELLNDKDLKVLSHNVKDDCEINLWIEKIATFANKARVPKDWCDLDVAGYKLKIKELSLKFLAIESLADKKAVRADKSIKTLLQEIEKLSETQKITLMRKAMNI